MFCVCVCVCLYVCACYISYFIGKPEICPFSVCVRVECVYVSVCVCVSYLVVHLILVIHVITKGCQLTRVPTHTHARTYTHTLTLSARAHNGQTRSAYRDPMKHIEDGWFSRAQSCCAVHAPKQHTGAADPRACMCRICREVLACVLTYRLARGVRERASDCTDVCIYTMTARASSAKSSGVPHRASSTFPIVRTCNCACTPVTGSLSCKHLTYALPCMCMCNTGR